jgi:hypothetical protein
MIGRAFRRSRKRIGNLHHWRLISATFAWAGDSQHAFVATLGVGNLAFRSCSLVAILWPFLVCRAIDFAYHSRRIACHDNASRNVFGDDTASTNDASIADCHSRTNNRPPSDPDITADCNRLAELLVATQIGFQWVCGGVDMHARSDENKAADMDVTNV